MAQGLGSGTSIAVAMVLLTSPDELTGEALTSAWSSTWSDDPPLADLAGDSPLAFDLDGMTAGVVVIPAPIPHGELAGPAATSWLWPGAPEAIKAVRAHVITTVAGAGAPLDAHRALTRLVTAVIGATDALGVYWGSAGLVHRADLFSEVARSDPSGVLVPLWVDLRTYVEGGRSSLFTVGLANFGLMEIEVPSSARPPGELRLLVLDIATYLILNGPVIQDGHTVGGDETERILARHGPSMIDRPGPVLSLEGC